jgi:hypothetical protein
MVEVEMVEVMLGRGRKQVGGNSDYFDFSPFVI